MTSIDTFRVNVPQRTLGDLQERLRRTRWADEIDNGWTLGTDYGELRALVDYWTTVFDWRRQEEAIYRFAQFRASVHGVGVHFIHERGVGEDPLPIILTHGYPDSILRLLVDDTRRFFRRLRGGAAGALPKFGTASTVSLQK